MPNYLKTTLLLLALFAIGVAQTRNDFRSKYNDPVYEIRPNVWMSAKFADDGQTCEVVIKEQNNCRVGAILLRSETGIKELINDLAPESQRGKLINHSELAADCCVGFTDEYTNVTVNLNDQAQPLGGISYSALSIRWKHRKCKEVK